MFGGCYNAACVARMNLIRKFEETLRYCNEILPHLSSDEQAIIQQTIFLVNRQLQSILNPNPSEQELDIPK